MSRNFDTISRFGRSVALRHVAMATVGVGLSGSFAAGAIYTWDVTPGDGATITAGSGTWDLTASNAVWNNAGTNVAWSNSLHAAAFGGADGTYAISLATNPITVDGAVNNLGGMRFLNSGYTLSALTPQIVQVGTSGANTNSYLSVASGKSATIGSNVTVWGRQIGQIFNIDGGGTLNVVGTGASLESGLNLFNIIGGTTVNIGAGGRVYTLNSQFLVGTAAGSGTLIVDGGTVRSDTPTATHNFILANNTTGNVTGTLTINSGSVVFPAAGDGTNGGLRIGPGVASVGTSNGYVNLNGGTIEIGRIFEPTGLTGTRYSEFNFNGGTLKVRANIAAASANVYMNTLDHAYVKEGGAVIDTNGKSIVIAQVLEHGGVAALDGGLTKKGAGNLTLGGANSYTGKTTVSQGSLTLASTGSINSSSSIDVAAGATLDVSAYTAPGGYQYANTVKGNGTVVGEMTLSGTLAPGSSAGLLTFNGSLTLASSATTSIEVEGAGTTRGADVGGNGYDAINISNGLTYDGTLNVNFVAGAPAAGSNFDLFDFNSATSDFDSINISYGGLLQGSLLGSGTWTALLGGLEFTFAGSSGVLSVTASTIPEPLAATSILLLAGRVLGRRSREM